MKNLQRFNLNLIQSIFGMLSSLMIFFAVLVLKNSTTSFTGLEVAFGTEFANLGSWASGEIAFNPFVLLAFMLPLIGAVITLFVPKGFKIANLFYLIAIILFFVVPELTKTTVTVLGTVTEIDVNWTFGNGLIFAALFSLIALILGVMMMFRSKVYNQ